MKIHPNLVAELVAALAPRVRKRVDALLADGVPVGPQVQFQSATVSLAAVEVITEPSQLTCDCLLAPGCAHRAAVALSLPLAEAAPEPDPQPLGASVADPPTDAPKTRPLSPQQRRTASLALDHLAEVLVTGNSLLSATQRAELAADLHRIRVNHLVVADRALTSYLGSLTADPGQRCAAFAAASLNLHRLLQLPAAGDASELLGQARRGYREVSGLNLVPLFAEPILTASGFAGVQVTFRDPCLRTWQLVRMRPGGAADVAWHYQAGQSWGGISASQAELSRHGLLVAQGTARDDGRLGGGSRVRAAVQGPALGWDQLPSGFRLVAGEITDGDRLGLSVAGQRLELLPGAVALGAGLATELFGAARGTQVSCLARGDELLGMTAGSGVIHIPQPLGVWWPGLDVVDRSWAGELPEAVPEADAVDVTGWLPQRQQVNSLTKLWCQRVLDAGPSVLGSQLLDADARWARDAGASFASELLLGLRQATQTGARNFDGAWRPDPGALLLAWLRLSQY